MKIFDKTERAYMRLKASYFLKGFVTWPVNPKADVPYKIGVTLDWPNKPNEVVMKQKETVKKLAEKTAEKYGLEALVEGPTWAAGGTLVMYVGLK